MRQSIKLSYSMLVVGAACTGGVADFKGGDDTTADAGTDGGNSGADSQIIDGNDASNTNTVFVYAHTMYALYKVDPDTLAITKVGDFGWPNGLTDAMTDIAVDKSGAMFGVSFNSVYKVDPQTAQCTRVGPLPNTYITGLSFVPAAMLSMTGDDVLVGTRRVDDVVFSINPLTGDATQVGRMGAGFQSSGDLVAVDGFGTVQTVVGAPWDKLVRLAPTTFGATPIGTDTGYGQVWGLAFWKGKVFGFTSTGQFLLIDPNTGAAMIAQSNGPAWWGAGVTTMAPVI